jgi:hypothetical protein
VASFVEKNGLVGFVSEFVILAQSRLLEGMLCLE